MIRPARAALGIAAASLGCGAPSAAPSAPATAVHIAPPSPAPPASASATNVVTVQLPPKPGRAVAGYPPPLEAPAGCSLTGAWAVGQPRALSLRPGERPFAQVHQATRAELVLPVAGDAPSAFADLSSDGVRVWGFVDGRAVVLHAARPLVMAGYVVPGASFPLTWLGPTDSARSPAQSDRFTVTSTPPPEIKPVAPPTEGLACSDLALDRASFQPRDAIAVTTLKTMQLAGGRRVALSATAGGRAVAHLEYDPGTTPLADVLERDGHFARVYIHPLSGRAESNVGLVGWLPDAVLAPHLRGTGGSWSGGGRSSWGTSQSGRSRVTCAHAVPLVAERGGERLLVGTVSAGIAIDVLAGPADPQTAEWVPVLLKAARVQPGDGAALVMKRAALADCTDTPP